MPILTTFRSLRYRDYRLLWFGTLFSSAGQWIQSVTISWLAYELTGSPLLLGLVNGLRSVPLLLLGPFGGVAADRVDRKRLMLSTQIGLLIVTFVFATLIVSGRLEFWHIVVFTLLTGIGWAFSMPVRQSIIPNVVPPHELMNAMALNSAGMNLTRVFGPSLAGLLIATIGAGENFYIQSAAYLGVAMMVVRLRLPAIATAPRVSIRENLVEGAAFIWRHPTLRTQMALALVPVLITLPYISLMPIFARDVLGVGSAGFGLMMSAPGIGALIGTLTIATLREVRGKGIFLVGGVLLQGIGLAVFSQIQSFPLALLMLVLIGCVQMVYMTTNQTLMQMTTPDELRGRVMGIYLLDQGLLPFGSLMAGAMADLFGAPTTVLFLGTATSLLALAFLINAPSLRRL